MRVQPWKALWPLVHLLEVDIPSSQRNLVEKCTNLRMGFHSLPHLIGWIKHLLALYKDFKCSACIHACVPGEWVMTVEAGESFRTSGIRITNGWAAKWVLGTKQGSSGRPSSVLSHLSSPNLIFKKKISLNVSNIIRAQTYSEFNQSWRWLTKSLIFKTPPTGYLRQPHRTSCLVSRIKLSLTKERQTPYQLGL